MNDTRIIDGFGPLPVVCPSTIAEVGEIVRGAAAKGQAIYPVGGGTMLDYGLPPAKAGIAVDLRGLDRVIDYPARDMTITVEAGITIAKLAEILRAEGQHLPIDVPLPERATLGGAMATNASGPRRFGYGTLRDYVIGISVVNDLGQTVKGGGRVVKNVAGYDMMKLYTGSLGTLGIIAQVTLKVRPLPEAVVAIVAKCRRDLEPILTSVLPKTATRPTTLSVANAPAKLNPREENEFYSVLISIEGSQIAVNWQNHKLYNELPFEVEKLTHNYRGEAATSLISQWSDFTLLPTSALTFKANMLPASTSSFLLKADDLNPRPLLIAQAGNGIVVGHLPADTTREQAQAALEKLDGWAEAAGGNVIVTRCPTSWKSVVPVWGRSTPDRVLMRAVKDKLDPHRLFNPGRFVDGI